MNRPSPAWYAAFTSLVGMLIASPLPAAERTAGVKPTSPEAVDVALDHENFLHGQVMSPNGEPVGKTTLAVLQQGETLHRKETDAQGKFECQLPRGGTYQIVLDNTSTSVRVWTAKAAPPECPQRLVVVKGDILRGQSGRIPYKQLNPWVVAGVVAVAVAIPVVLSNHRSDRSDGS